jgi:DEAD/DEAH box helicase domain-containing protein
MNIRDHLTNERWEVVHTEHLPPINAGVFPTDSLPFSETTRRYLSSKFPSGIYQHQRLAVLSFLNSRHVCLTTGTASGKSLAFYLSAFELLSKFPDARIVAIYPMRALAKEQEDRWTKALQDAGLHYSVGRIDGQIPMQARPEIVRRSRVLILTPDVMHAWVFTQLSTRPVIEFLKNLRLIIVDEVHSYTGVFGSNSGFLFRRLRHVLDLLGQEPQFICASATIADSKGHLFKLFGLDFEILDQSTDTSPRQPIKVDLLRPPLMKDLFTEISSLLSALSKDSSNRFIAFVDSRKQTELLASIVSRETDDEGDEEPDDEAPKLEWDHLVKLNILPYRAGYEEEDRMTIQDRLSKGTLAGVISTSALELGMDIPHLNVGVLIGVPYSSTSFHQRIGRIGRHSPGHILIISRGNVFDETLFAKPTELLKRPLAEGALYLENQRIQYIHALCIARHGGEHDQVLAALVKDDKREFTSTISWPAGFRDLCAKERLGEISPELQSMKGEAGEDPNHTYPLRDVEVQFKVQYKTGGTITNKGELSYSQLMREAYPGAVYYYTTKAYRVTKINLRSREVQVRHEKRYTTNPIQLPTMIFPNLSTGNIFQAKSFGKVSCIECNLQVRESIAGYAEKRGPNKITVQYPTDSKATGVFFDQQRFSRNFFTTGVILSHPCLERNRVETELICSILFEAFLMIVPFERRDISYAVDKHRQDREQFAISKDCKFLAIYDQTYGSLRLTSRLLQGDTLKATIEKAIEICSIREVTGATKETIQALQDLLSEARTTPRDFAVQTEEERQADNLVRVLLPRSRGIAIQNGNKEFLVEGIFFDSRTQRLSYRGRYVEQQYNNDTTKVIIPVEGLVEVPGESNCGFYSLETGEIINA